MAESGELDRRQAVDGLPPPTGPWAWTVAWDGLVFVSGVRGIDPTSGRLPDDDETRLELIFAHLERALAANGSSLRRVLSTRVYVTDMARHRPLVNAAYERYFGPDRPTRTIVEVSALNQGDTIEIEVVAARAPARRQEEGRQP